MRRMIVLLTTVLLLGSASVAAAECAWVLWLHESSAGPNTRPQSWSIQKVFQEEAECGAARKGAFKKVMGHLRDLEKAGVAVAQENEAVRWDEGNADPHSVTFRKRLICLPDTIDPRERKE